MKNLKKLLCMVLCIALMSTAAFAAPEGGSYSKISEPIVEIGNPMTGNDTMAKAATSPVTFSDTTLNYDRDTFGTNLKREFVAGRSGAEGDYAMKISANVSNVFGGVSSNSLKACGWRMFYDSVADAYQATMEGKPVVVEFDIKVDTTCDIYGLLLYRTWALDGNDSYYLFNADGKIVGTDYAYEADKWYHFRWEIDGKKAYVDITPDGGETTRIVNGAWSTKGIDNTYQGTFFLTQETQRGDGDTKAGMTIDNWRHYYYVKPANGDIVSPEGTSVSSGENFIFRVTAEAEEGDEIDLRVDGTSIATFDAWEGIYDYAADVDHCSIDAGAHVLSAYKVTDGFEEKIAEKIVSKVGKAAGAIPANGGVYPTGVETFDNMDANALTPPYYLTPVDGKSYIHGADPNWTGGTIADEGASGQPGDKSYTMYSFGNQVTAYGLYIIDNPADTYFTDGGLWEMEFDIKLQTTTDAVALYGMGGLWADENKRPDEQLFGRHQAIFLNQDGKVLGTDVEYKANEWMHFKIQYDFDNDKWNVWKDAVQIVKNVSPVKASDGIKENRHLVRLSLVNSPSDGDSTQAKLWIDNLSIHQWFEAPALASVSYATDSASGIATTDLSVTDAAKSVTLTLDKDVDAVGDANVEVLVNDVAKAVSGVSYSAKAVTIPLPAISAGDKVSVTLKGVKAGGTEIGNISATLNVKATGLYIAQNKIIGSSIKTQMYNGGAEKEAMLIAVVFDGNRMTDVSIINETIPSGEKVYTFPLKEAPGAKQVKLMVWDNGLQPILEKAAE